MADFFDKLKQGLNKGVTTASVRSKEMLDANRLKSKIADCERQKKKALTELGKTIWRGTTVCTMQDSGHHDEEALKVAHLAIASLDAQIAEKQQELARVHTEAEQALADPPKASPASDPVPSTCVCGATLPVGVKFCGSCGRRTDAAQV
jgi:hypothetical protein